MTETKAKAQNKRQWGSEKNIHPLPILHDRPSTRKITLSRIAIVMTVLFWIMYVIDTVIRQFFDGPHTFNFTVQAVGYLIVVTLLTFSALIYLITRQGAFQRFSTHLRVPRAELDAHFHDHAKGLTVLIPSYSEEISVIRKSMISALLQEYPNKRVVLLIDDNPVQHTSSARQKLEHTRDLKHQIDKLFAEPQKRFGNFKSAPSINKDKKSIIHHQTQLTEHYRWAAEWLTTFAEREVIDDHVDTFFVDHVIRALADELRLIVKALEASAHDEDYLPPTRLSQLYQRLAWIFCGEVDTFERKAYRSLSHEANKAMNLNSYIGLMGGSYRRASAPEGNLLVPVPNGSAQADVVIPDSDFILTLDADSILLREYCLRLVHYLEQSDNERVAVVQTPYSAFRGAPTRIERLAGATTDMQHILHQGMTKYGATFWVGANAVIRKKALEDVVQKEWIGGFEIKRYIQDWTVIEDTESSIDLTRHGWTLYNYPERLSYSATPPDFGSLIVQRRRWANGGLLILPKLFSRMSDAKRTGERVSAMEIMIRINYMASIAWASFGLIFMLAYPYDGRLLSPLVVLAALPYFMAMASDLKYSGYRRSDVFRIYGFNLILLPVNLAGVLKSIQQALTGKKIPFARTPKVKNHTISPALFLIVPLLIVAFSVWIFMRSFETSQWGSALFAAFNIVLSVWAIVAYIGVRATLTDTWVSFKQWLFVEADTQTTSTVKKESAFDWRTALYHGDVETPAALRRTADGLNSRGSHQT